MFKLVMLLKKRPDISREQFRDYYSNRHVPFVHKLLKKGAAIHRRNFVVTSNGGEGEDYDAIVEVFYEDRQTAEAAASALGDPEIRRMVEEDEDKFIQRGSIRRYIVEVQETRFRPIEGV